jgi:hypothetical protein
VANARELARREAHLLGVTSAVRQIENENFGMLGIKFQGARMDEEKTRYESRRESFMTLAPLE